MVGAVGERNPDVNDGEASQDAGSQDRVQALFNAGDIFLRNCAVDDLAFESIAGTVFIGLDLEDDTGELGGTKRLLLVCLINFGGPCDGLVVGNLRGASIDCHALRYEGFEDAVELSFTHTANECFTTFRIDAAENSGVTANQRCERRGKHFNVVPGFQLDLHLDQMESAAGFGHCHFLVLGDVPKIET